MTFYLHIGTHKTGTSTIQRFAKNNRSTLRNAGLWYPKFKKHLFSAFEGTHHNLAHAIAGKDRHYSIDDARRFFERVASKMAPGEKILISAEPIFRHVIKNPNFRGEELYGEDFWNAHRHYLHQLRSIIPTNDIKVIVIYRRQDSFAPSLYQEHIKATQYKKHFNEFIAEKRHLFEYGRHTQELAEIFGTVIARPYESVAQDDSLVRNFFKIIGIDVMPKSSDARVNKSLPFELIELKRLLNQANLRPVSKKKLRQAIEELANDPEITNEIMYSWISLQKMRQFQATFDEENKNISKFSDFISSRPFFSSEKAMSTEVFPGLSAQQAINLVGKLLETNVYNSKNCWPSKKRKLIEALFNYPK